MAYQPAILQICESSPLVCGPRGLFLASYEVRVDARHSTSTIDHTTSSRLHQHQLLRLQTYAWPYRAVCTALKVATLLRDAAAS